MVEYENCNFRGSFQVKKVLSFREAGEVEAAACSCVLSSSRLHSPLVVVSSISASQSLVPQYMFASRMSSISNLLRHKRVSLRRLSEEDRGGINWTNLRDLHNSRADDKNASEYDVYGVLVHHHVCQKYSLGEDET